MLKFDKFLARKGNIDQDFGPLRFLLLDFGPLVKKVGHPCSRWFKSVNNFMTNQFICAKKVSKFQYLELILTSADQDYC